MEYFGIFMGITVACGFLYGAVEFFKIQKQQYLETVEAKALPAENYDGLNIERNSGVISIKGNFPSISVKPKLGETWGDSNWETFKTGDPEFDKKRIVKAGSLNYLAILDSPARKVLKDFNINVDIYGINIPWGETQKNAEIEKTCVQLARRFLDTDLQTGAIENLADPQVGVRITNMRILREYEIDQETKEKIKPMIKDPNPEIALLAAELTENIPRLLDMVLHPEVGVTAVEAINKLKQSQRLPQFLDKTIPVKTLLRIVEVLGETDAKKHAEQMIKAVESNANEFLNQAVAQILLKIGQHNETYQKFLVQLLSSKDRETQVAAAKALEKCGHLSAVEPMHHLLQSKPKEELRTALNKSIRTIQSKYAQTGAGGLTINTDNDKAGALSTTNDKEGGLSKPN